MKKLLTLISTILLTVAFSIMFTACGHTCEFSADWTVGDNTHYHKCLDEDCDEIADEAEHAFNLKVETEDYLKEPATATTNAKYFYSCECGAKGTEHFDKEKEEQVLDLSCESIIGHNKTYDKLFVPKITAEDLGLSEDVTITTYYKVKDADDTNYSTSRVYEAGNYTVKIVVSETAENKALTQEIDFEIKPRVITLDPNVTTVFYTGDNSQLIAPSHYHYSDIIESDGNITATATFSGKDVGVYSIEEGTLSVKSYWDNPNYVFAGSIRITKRNIISRDGIIKITLEEGKTLYTVDLAEQGICCEGDDVKAGIYVASSMTEAGIYDLYWKFPGGGVGITLPLPQYAGEGEGLMGKDAKNYNFSQQSLSNGNIYYIKVQLIVPTAE